MLKYEEIVTPANHLSTSENYWYKTMKPRLYFWTAVTFTCLSLFVLLGEVTLGLSLWGNNNTIWHSLNSVFLNVIVLILMMYIVYATLYGLFKIKLLSFYALHKG